MMYPRFGFKVKVQIVTARYGAHAPTESKNVISSYPQITQAILKTHCEILWENKSEANLGFHPKADYGYTSDNATNQVMISQQSLI